MPDSATTIYTDIMISELPAAPAANATDQLEANQAGTTRSITLDQVSTVVAASDQVAAVVDDAIGAIPPAPPADWDDITDKPSTFPPTLPIPESGVTNLVTDLAGKAPVSHTHTAANITDFAESVDDRVATLLVAGANITTTYNDSANTLTIASTASGGGGGTTILDGSGPPADGLGDEDDYYLDSDAGILYGPKTSGVSYGPAVNAVPAASAPSPGFSHATIEIGSYVNFTAAGRVSAVRWWYDASTTQTTFKVNVWNTSGTRLATATATGVAPGISGWQSVALATPLDVVATQTIVVSVGNTNAYSRQDSATFPVSDGHPVRLTQGVYGLALDVFPSTVAATINFYVDVNFHEVGSEVWPIAIEPGSGGGAATFVGDSPPASPTDGQLWWESDSGQGYIRFNDGSSTQWVPFTATAPGWVQITQAAYDALSPPDPNTLYVVVG